MKIFFLRLLFILTLVFFEFSFFDVLFPRVAVPVVLVVSVVAWAGVGKSTLVNRMVGAKVSIVTQKVQTTRFPVRGVAMTGQLSYNGVAILSRLPMKDITLGLVGQAVAGVGGALILPNSVAILAATFPDPHSRPSRKTFYYPRTAIQPQCEAVLGAAARSATPAAVALLRKAARQNSPIAQNRLARVLAYGQGAQQDKVEALKWHWIAKTSGKGDPELDEFLADVPAADRAKAEAEGRKWLGTK